MDYRRQRIENMTDEEIERDELLKQRLIDPDTRKMFRNAYAFKAYNFSTLKPYCEDIKVVIDGYGDHIDVVRRKLEKGLEEFDPDKDIIVPVGRANDNFLVGQIIHRKLMDKPKKDQNFVVAMYMDFSYTLYRLYLDPSVDSYEILTK